MQLCRLPRIMEVFFEILSELVEVTSSTHGCFHTGLMIGGSYWIGGGCAVIRQKHNNSEGTGQTGSTVRLSLNESSIQSISLILQL